MQTLQGSNTLISETSDANNRLSPSMEALALATGHWPCLPLDQAGSGPVLKIRGTFREMLQLSDLVMGAESLHWLPPEDCWP